MLKALSKYSAIATKVRALRAKMLTEADWQKLCSLASVQDVLAYLKASPGWKEAMARIKTAEPGAQELESALRLEVFGEYEKLCSFAYGEDRRFLLNIVYKIEYELILSALRRISSTRELPPDDIPDFFRKHSRVDLDAISQSRDLSELMAATKGGVFEDILKSAPRAADGLPDYAWVSSAMEKRYYSLVYSRLAKGYGGLGKKALVESIGMQADLLNIVYLLRLRRLLGPSRRIPELLIPVRYKLTDDFILELAGAPSDSEAMAVLNKSRWKSYFESFEALGIERYYERAVEEFCRKLISSSAPSLCIPHAYLTLKEIECHKLIRLIEAIRYGIDPQSVI